MSEPRESLCQHIAIIMDGNGRWAKKRMMPRAVGHNVGVKAVKRTVTAAIELNVKVLTLYAFSTENWCRPDEEVSFLMKLFIDTLEKESQELHDAGVRLSFIGDLTKLPPMLVEKLGFARKLTENNTVLDLVIALNYGARAEITRLCQQIALDVREGRISSTEIDDDYINQHLALGNLPPVDLLIRSSGEQRLSNFLLWQLAYSELYFTETLWPDFEKQTLKDAIEAFQKRERRFGAI